MSSRTKKWIVAILAFAFMWIVWGFNEEANIVNNIGYFGMVFAFIEWTESRQVRSELVRMQHEAAEWRAKAHTLIDEIHRHNVTKQ